MRLRLPVSPALPACPRRDGLSCRIQDSHASDDHGPGRYTYGAHMTDLSRRKLILSGVAATAGVSGRGSSAAVGKHRSAFAGVLRERQDVVPSRRLRVDEAIPAPVFTETKD